MQTTAGTYMPAHTLYTSISDFGESENERGGNKTSFHEDEDKLDYAHKKMTMTTTTTATIINESSQRIGDDIVYLPNQPGPHLENRYENSDAQSIIESQMHKRDAEPQDMCDTNECKCKQETKFLTVDCHFQQVSTFFVIQWVFSWDFGLCSKLTSPINWLFMCVCSTLRYNCYN